MSFLYHWRQFRKCPEAQDEFKFDFWAREGDWEELVLEREQYYAERAVYFAEKAKRGPYR